MANESEVQNKLIEILTRDSDDQESNKNDFNFLLEKLGSENSAKIQRLSIQALEKVVYYLIRCQSWFTYFCCIRAVPEILKWYSKPLKHSPN